MLLTLSLTTCDNDDDSSCDGVDCLPPATTTGAGTFGCLVNGEPFLDNSGNFNCFYQLVDGEYFFGIDAEDNVVGVSQVFLGSDKNSIVPNALISLNSDKPGNFYGGLNINNLGGT